jgi:hypothetical protein
MGSMEQLGMVVRRWEGARDGTRRGRANGDGAERLGAGGRGLYVRDVQAPLLYASRTGPGPRRDRWFTTGGRPTRGGTTRGRGDSEMPRCVRVLVKTSSLGRHDHGR